MEAVPISMSFGWRLWQTLREFVHLAARLLPKTEIQISSRTDRMATEALNTYGNAILRCAYSYLHNMADAEEILQDTLLKLLTAAPRFESEEHKKAWLLKVAANLSKNRIEYNALRDCDELDESLSFVWEAVKQLPPQYREVIHLHYYEGYSTEEMAQILSRNPSTIRSDLRRGREKLKSVLKEAYDFEV